MEYLMKREYFHVADYTESGLRKTFMLAPNSPKKGRILDVLSGKALFVSWTGK
jgi:hypothetical protein